MTGQSVVIDGKVFVVGETYGPAPSPGRTWGKTRTIEAFFTHGVGGFRYVRVRYPKGGTQAIKLSSFATWARDKVKIAPETMP